MDRPLAVVAMSGGVDSSVAAALLLEAGYRVEGVSLRLWDSPRRDGRVCSDHRDAAAVARHLGIAHSLIDQRAEFERRVVTAFAAAYAAGRTPNPCAACNSDFKLGVLLDHALERGAELVATGHYARVERRGTDVVLRRGIDPQRDQSYFLFGLTRRQLAHVAFPLGEWTKSAVRRRAAELGLPVAGKPDSQDLCFGDPAALVRSRALGGKAGEIVDGEGRGIGRHGGIERFTIGQRRGLGVAGRAPLYVQALDAPGARVIVGVRPPRAGGFVAGGWSWIAAPPAPGEWVAVQVRYRQPPLAARIAPIEGGQRARVELARPAVAAAPGQAVVVYRDDEVLGGGWIEQPLAAEGVA